MKHHQNRDAFWGFATSRAARKTLSFFPRLGPFLWLGIDFCPPSSFSAVIYPIHKI